MRPEPLEESDASTRAHRPLMAILTLYVLAFTVLTVLAVRRRDLLAVTAGVAGLLGSLWGRRLLWRDRRRDAGGDE